MEPRDESAPGGQDSIDIVTSRDLERIANPLTVVHGYTELLQRRIRRGQTIQDEELLRILGLIEAASRSSRAGLAALVARAHARNLDPDPD